jgi:hypothetical protein
LPGDKEKFVRKRRYAKIDHKVKIRRTMFEDEGPQKYLKERWTKPSQKVENASAFKKPKDGQNHVKHSKMANDHQS